MKNKAIALLVGEYIGALPADPSAKNSGQNGSHVNNCNVEYDTGYTIKQDANGQYTLTAPLAEINETVEYSF